MMDQPITLKMRGMRPRTIATRSQHLNKSLYELFVFAFKQDLEERRASGTFNDMCRGAYSVSKRYDTPEARALLIELNK